MRKHKRAKGYYWVFGNECFDVQTWDIAYWDGFYFWQNDDDFDESIYTQIDDKQIIRNNNMLHAQTRHIDNSTKIKKTMKTIKAKVVRLRARNQKYQVKKGDLFINDSRNHDWGSLEALVCERVTRDGFAWNGYGIQTDINHLYFTNDEKIEEGDWCILLENHYINGGVGKYNKERAIGYGLHNTKFFKKIIATNNPLIEPICDGKCAKYECVCIFPQIPQSFIKEYVKSGGSIDEVELEIEETFTDAYTEDRMRRFYGKSKIKTDSDNCVIVPTVKDSWSREEVEKLLLLAFNANRYSITRQEDWIKENMK